MNWYIFSVSVNIIFVMLPDTDKCLVEDETFRSFVELYASNKSAFFVDYAVVFLIIFNVRNYLLTILLLFRRMVKCLNWELSLSQRRASHSTLKMVTLTLMSIRCSFMQQIC